VLIRSTLVPSRLENLEQKLAGRMLISGRTFRHEKDADLTTKYPCSACVEF
jgi:hypothetical protein